MKIHGVNVGGPGAIHGVRIDRLAPKKIHGVTIDKNAPKAIHGQKIDPNPQRVIHGAKVSDPRTDAVERQRREDALGWLIAYRDNLRRESQK